MEKKYIPTIISGSVIFGGLIVMAGWIFNIPVLTSVSHLWATTKFTTALAFVLCGLMLFFLSEKKRTDLADVVISLSAFSVLLLMAIYLIFVYAGIDSGLEKFVVAEKEGAILTAVPGRPSIISMYVFTLIALSGLTYSFHFKTVQKIISWIGWFLIFMGGLAIIGYGFNKPILYYAIPNQSTAISLITAVLFVLIGIGFVLLPKKSVSPILKKRL